MERWRKDRLYFWYDDLKNAEYKNHVHMRSTSSLRLSKSRPLENFLRYYSKILLRRDCPSTTRDDSERSRGGDESEECGVFSVWRSEELWIFINAVETMHGSLRPDLSSLTFNRERHEKDALLTYINTQVPLRSTDLRDPEISWELWHIVRRVLDSGQIAGYTNRLG